MGLLEVQGQLGKIQGIDVAGAVNLVYLGVEEASLIVNMPFARGLGILNFELSGFTIRQVKLLCEEVLHIIYRQPCSSQCHPDVLGRNVRGLHFL